MNGVQLLSPSAARDHADMRPQHHHVGDLEALQQQRQQAQIRGQHVDLQRGLGGAAAFQADVVKRDIAAGKHRDVDAAVDDELKAGDGADLRLHRLAQASRLRNQDVANRPISATPSNAATGIPRRFIPWAIVNDISGSG